MNDPRHEQLEAIPPGRQPQRGEMPPVEGRDLSEHLAADEQLRSHWQAVQVADARIQEALGDVPVPEDLADRLLASLASPADVTGTPAKEPQTGQAWYRRRRWQAALAVAAALLLAIGVQLLRAPAELASLDSIARQGIGWLQDTPAEAWQPFDRDRHDLPWEASRFASFDSEFGPVDAFDFGPRVGGQLVLFRLQVECRETLPPVPLLPIATSGAWRAGVWRQGADVYLVITDDERLLDVFRQQFHTV